MKLEKIFEEYKEAAARRDENVKETAKLRRKRKELEFRFNQALEREDRAGAKAIRAEIDDLLKDIEINDKISVKAKVTDKEVADAWKQYADEIGSDIAKKQDEIVSLREKLSQLVKDMLTLQNEALKMRESLSQYTGHRPETYKVHAIANDGKRVPVATTFNNPDVIYLASSGEWEMDKTFKGNDAVSDAYMIICMGKHVEKPHF